jgi:hypothetical protein
MRGIGGLSAETLQLLGKLRKDVTTAGISTSTNLVYYNLEPLARIVYPVHFPLLASIPRVKSESAGPGTAVHWKVIPFVDTGLSMYPGTSEGNRNAVINITERDYTAPFAYLGKEINTTFPAQYAAEGFDNAVGLANRNALNALLNSEERMILFGNRGTSGNGFQLGTANTPTVSVVAGTSAPASQRDNPLAGGFANATYVSVACVALTGWGITLNYSVTLGLTPTFTRTNADGSQDQINGGSSAISAMSTVAEALTATPYVKAVTVAVRGALGYAWYVDTTDTSTGSLANAKLAAITTTPVVYLGQAPAGTQLGSLAALGTDYSANPLDFDGITTWTFGNGANNAGGTWTDLAGAGLTANGDGSIQEFETILSTLWNLYKLSPDRILLGGTMSEVVTRAIMTGPAAGSTTGVTVSRFMMDPGSAVGGTLATTYRRKFVVSAGLSGQDIPLVTHPWLPDGCIYFDLVNSPYMDSNIPAVRRIMTMAEHFTIAWPLRSLKWEAGTYVFETMEHYIPWGSAILTGVGHFVNGQAV